MSLTILSTPDEYQPIYSIDGHNLSFVLDSTISQQCSMKYVADVYVRGEYVNTIKNSPNLDDGKCVIQIGEYIQPFISLDKWVGPNFQVCTQSFATYSVRFGEESDGSLDCSGTSFDTIMSGATFSDTAFNGTIQYLEKTFDATGYLMQTGATGSFLTNSPRSRYVNINDHDFLYFISNVSVSATASGFDSRMHVQVRTTSLTGTLTNYYIVNRVPSPVGALICLAIGPEDINNYVTQNIVYDDSISIVGSPIITCNTRSYEITLGYRNMSPAS